MGRGGATRLGAAIHSFSREIQFRTLFRLRFHRLSCASFFCSSSVLLARRAAGKLHCCFAQHHEQKAGLRQQPKRLHQQEQQGEQDHYRNDVWRAERKQRAAALHLQRLYCFCRLLAWRCSRRGEG
jgi:hypothetical protein